MKKKGPSQLKETDLQLEMENIIKLINSPVRYDKTKKDAMYHGGKYCVQSDLLALMQDIYGHPPSTTRMHVLRLASMKKIQKHGNLGRDKYITLVEK